MKFKISLKFLIILSFYLFFQPDFVISTIGCYKCSTLDNDTACVDPFSPGETSNDYYDSDCRAGIDGRIGLFPAKYCLKVSGTNANTNEQVVIRTCTWSKLLDVDSSYSSFTLKVQDSDLNIVNGLISSCRDDGCNSISLLRHNKYLLLFSTLAVLLSLLL